MDVRPEHRERRVHGADALSHRNAARMEHIAAAMDHIGAGMYIKTAAMDHIADRMYIKIAAMDHIADRMYIKTAALDHIAAVMYLKGAAMDHIAAVIYIEDAAMDHMDAVIPHDAAAMHISAAGMEHMAAAMNNRAVRMARIDATCSTAQAAVTIPKGHLSGRLAMAAAWRRHAHNAACGPACLTNHEPTHRPSPFSVRRTVRCGGGACAMTVSKHETNPGRIVTVWSCANA